MHKKHTIKTAVLQENQLIYIEQIKRRISKKFLRPEKPLKEKNKNNYCKTAECMSGKRGRVDDLNIEQLTAEQIITLDPAQAARELMNNENALNKLSQLLHSAIDAECEAKKEYDDSVATRKKIKNAIQRRQNYQRSLKAIAQA